MRARKKLSVQGNERERERVECAEEGVKERKEREGDFECWSVRERERVLHPHHPHSWLTPSWRH